MTTFCKVAEEVEEGSMRTILKELYWRKYIVKNRTSEVPPEAGLSKVKMNIGIKVDGLWGSRGWTSKLGILDVCFEDTGKVIEVILKTWYCKVGKILKHNREVGIRSVLQYIERHNEHEPDCLLNHKGSASVSENLLDHCKKYLCPKYCYSKYNYQWNVLK